MLGKRSDQKGLWEADRLYLDYVGILLPKRHVLEHPFELPVRKTPHKSACPWNAIQCF